MKTSKKILAYTAMFLTSESEVFSSTINLLDHGTQRYMTHGLQKITQWARPTTIATRLYTQNSGGRDLDQLMHESRELFDQNAKMINELRRYMNEFSQLLEQANKNGLLLNHQKNNGRDFAIHPQAKVKPEKKIAVITPINQQNSLAVLPQHNPELEQMPPTQDNGRLYGQFRGQEAASENNVHNKINLDLKRIYMQRKDLLAEGIVEASNQKLNRAEVVAILDLYTILVRYNKDAITKVLNGSTDTSQSNIYSAIVRHGRSKGLTLSWYRGVYDQLCEVLGNKPTDVINKIAANVIRESRSLLRKRALTHEDRLYNVVIGAHPMYPVSPEEVGILLDAYQNLTAWKRDVVTKVLSGITNSSNSNTYAAFVKHAEANNLTLDFYRRIYAKLCRSDEGVAWINKVYRNISSTDTELKQNESPEQANYQLEEGKQLDRESMCSEDDNINSSVDEDRISDNASSLADTTLPEKEDNDEILTQGNYTLSIKEQKRLSRIYALLPDFDAKSITKALSGTTKNRSLPVWAALLEAIDKIKNEAIEEGDDTLINLKYFQRLHWASVRVTGKGGGIRNISASPQEVDLKSIPTAKPKAKVKSLKTKIKDTPITKPKSKSKVSKAPEVKEGLLAKRKGKIKTSRKKIV